LLYLRLALVTLFWSGTVIAIRIGGQTFGPFWGSTIRYALAAVAFLPLVLGKGKNPFRMNGHQWFQVTLLGLTGVFAYNYFVFRGLKTVQANHAALIMAMNPILVMLTSSWLHKDHITRRRLVGALLSLTGVAVVISRGDPSKLFTGHEPGDIYIVLGTLSWMVYTLVGRNALQTLSPLQASFWASVIGLVMLALLAIQEPWPAYIPMNAVWSELYLGLIGTVLGFVWFYEGVQKLGATRASLFNNLIPVNTMLLSVLILGEKLSGYALIGAALVMTGVLLVNLPWKTR
jgi:drug/metabolite transporter (DMT)-like permease